MNKAIIESIEWHKDQVFKLLEDGDLAKMEGSIHSVKSDLNKIIEKAKSKKKVWVKATANKKGHYRTQEVGQKEGEKATKLTSKEKRAIYSAAFEEGIEDKGLGIDSRQDDKYLNPKGEKEKIQADGYVDGWAEGYDEDEDEK